MAATTCKPKLPQLSTPVNSTFPISISGPSPLSAHPRSADPAKTPISPPLAYIEYLHMWSLNSPMTARPSLSGSTTPSTASSHSDCSCKAAASVALAAAAGESPFTPPIKSEDSDEPIIKDENLAPAPRTAPVRAPAPFTQVPLSAPAHGVSFPSLKVPPSPSVAGLSPYTSNSPLSARSPFSARAHQTKFDWEAALKARSAGEIRKAGSRTSVRHIREVVTRTVTYTPRMKPAPKGKRKKTTV